MEIEGSLLLVGLFPVSTITQEPNKNPIAFLERLKEALPPKVYQSGCRLLQGTGDFKGQIPVPICIRYQNLVTAATAAGPCFLFRGDDPDSHQYLLQQRTGEGGQGPGDGEKEKDKTCPDAGRSPGKPYGTPRVLEGQGMGQMPNL